MPLHRRRAERRRLREAVLGSEPRQPAPPVAGTPSLRVLTGLVLDASPHLLVVRTPAGEARLPMTGATTVWHGGRGGLAALRPGREVVVRVGGDGLAAERVWVDAGRVTGTILACGRDTVEVDMGPHRGRAHVVIPPHALGAVLVRHPRMEPGYLFDVICVRSPDGPRAVRPGTSQPGHRADQMADAALPGHVGGPAGPAGGPSRGTATWFGGGEYGMAYPAVDPEGQAGGCADAPAGCVRLPLLSLGSDVAVRNECTGRAATVPVVECGCVAARYCDRCVECGVSPRGRVAELSAAVFVGLGGDLENGCFNATVQPAMGDARW
ncbi:hypothetical protein [Actinomadura hibisca]|uniref:hypothetical protein n=1 Tax=Actinomadura hibisca TaxID=68565 RepID=UPI00082D9D6A|nr:hypothetical protein [Actinomadura hibisca]